MDLTTLSPTLPSFNDTAPILPNDDLSLTTAATNIINDLANTLADHLIGPYDDANHNNSNSSNNSIFSLSTNASLGNGTEVGASMGALYQNVEKIVLSTVCVIGIILNVLNLLVLTERCLKESPYTYLTAMAVLCLCSLAMSFMSHILMHSFPNNYYCFVYTFYLYYPCVNICANSTMWLTAMLTIERFLVVRHPLWARAKCDRRSAKIKICVIIALMTVLNIPRFMLYKVVQKPEEGAEHYTYEYTAFRTSQTFVVISWLYSVTIQLLPLTILCVFNFYLVYAVHQARRLRQRLQIRNNMEAEWSREQTRLTITLISIVFFFIICIMPSAFADLHVAYALFGGGVTREKFRISHRYVTLQKTSNLLVFCQLSFNFVLYSAFNDNFLAVFKRMLKRWAERVTRRVSGGGKGSRRHNNNNSSMYPLMRLDTVSGSGGNGRGGSGGRGGGKNDHRAPLRASNNSMSSQTKTSSFS